MPSIELVCVGQIAPMTLPEFPFALRTAPELISDRSPRPLFQHEFDQLRGWIYHLGNPRCKEAGYAGPFFAYELLSERSQDASEPNWPLEIDPDHRPGIEELLGLLLGASPDGLVLVTTDWQFGPAREERSPPLAESTFWGRHDAGGLRLNTLDPVRVDR